MQDSRERQAMDRNKDASDNLLRKRAHPEEPSENGSASDSDESGFEPSDFMEDS